MSFKQNLHKIIAMGLVLLLLSACDANALKAQLSTDGVHRNPISAEETDVNTQAPVAVQTEQVICIDPGHGFDDGGCSSEYLNGLNEDDINLTISLMVDEELRALGYQTVLTHDGKTFPITSAYDNNNRFRPEERTAYAATLDIDYYLSIHCNSHSDSSANGVRIYYYDGPPKTEMISGVIANKINDAILNSLEPGSSSTTVEMTSGVFHVLRATTVPASLIEVGFVTNESDAAKMIDPEWQRAFAKGVAAGIDRHFRTGASSLN